MKDAIGDDSTYLDVSSAGGRFTGGRVTSPAGATLHRLYSVSHGPGARHSKTRSTARAPARRATRCHRSSRPGPVHYAGAKGAAAPRRERGHRGEPESSPMGAPKPKETRLSRRADAVRAAPPGAAAHRPQPHAHQRTQPVATAVRVRDKGSDAELHGHQWQYAHWHTPDPRSDTDNPRADLLVQSTQMFCSMFSPRRLSRRPGVDTPILTPSCLKQQREGAVRLSRENIPLGS